MTAFAQSTSTTGSGVSSIAKAFTSNVGASSLLAIDVYTGSTTVTATVSDNLNGSHTANPAAGNAGSGVNQRQTGNGFAFQSFYFLSTTAGATTVTVTYSGSTSGGLAIHEYTSAPSSVDTNACKYGSAVTGGGPDFTITSGTPTGTGELAHVGTVVQNSNAAVTAPFNERESANFGSNTTADDLSVSAAVTCTGTTGGNAWANTGLVMFYTPAASAASGKPLVAPSLAAQQGSRW